MSQCQAVNSKGGQCEALPPEGSEFCAFHDPSPEARARHLRMSARGGISKANTRPANVAVSLKDASSILRTLQDAAEAMMRGELDRPRFTALAYGASAATNALKALKHESRLRRIEETLGLKDPEDEDASPPEAPT